MWPLIHPIGSSYYEAVCDTCTREKFGLEPDERFDVWVGVKKEKASAPIERLKKEKKKKSAPVDPLQDCLF